MQNSSQKTVIRVIVVGLLVLVSVGLITWGNIRFAEQNPGGNDFLVHWEGTRSFLVDGISPYSDTVALRIQQIAYGRPANPGEHELRVAYPLYSMLIFAPFAMIKNFTIARGVWMTFLEIGLVLLSVAGLKLTNWRPKFWLLLCFMLFSLLWYHAFRPLINGNAVILVALGMAVSLLLIQSKKDGLAGVVLGLTTIKPQVVILFIIFILIWALSVKRWRIIFWTIGTVVVLSLVATVFLPDWFVQNLREVVRYPGYNPPGTPGAVFKVYWPGIGKQLGWFLTGAMGILLVIEWALALNKDFRHFLWTACFTLFASQWIGIQTDPGNFIVLFLPLVLVFSIWCQRWKTGGPAVTVVSMIGLMIGLWFLFVRTITYNGQPIQSPLMFFPLPAFVFLGLYWVRWWAIQPAKLWVEALINRETSFYQG